MRRGMLMGIFFQMSMVSNELEQMEDVKLILTQKELDKIPTSVYKNISSMHKEKNNNCSVCRDEYNDNDEVKILNCEHVFHIDCIDNWLKNYSHKCPCCRQTSGNYEPNI
jgi:predicted transcriptional regulator